MRLKLQRPLVVFDIETTGLDPQSDRIVELAAIKIWPDGRTEEKHRRFNPQMPIPKDATRVHGITDADVLNEPTFAKVARGERGIASYFAGCDLAGFNLVRFDLPMLQAELERIGEPLDLSDVAVVDAYWVFAHYFPRNLAAAVQHYCHKPHEEAHTAAGDVRATWEVLAAQLDAHADLPDTPAAIDHFLRDPDNVDRLGKLKWMDGQVTVAFGRHRGRTLRYLAAEEPDYLRWMIDNHVIADGAVHHLRDALVGHFSEPPTPPVTD